MLLDELAGDRPLVIQVGQAESFALAAGLGEPEWPRPMTYQFIAELVRSLGGRVREVRLDALAEGSDAATVEAKGPQGVTLTDARASDALNVAVQVAAPITCGLELLEDCARRTQGDGPEAFLLQRALTSCPMTIKSIDP